MPLRCFYFFFFVVFFADSAAARPGRPATPLTAFVQASSVISWLYQLFETEPPCVTSGNRCPFTHLSSETILQVRSERARVRVCLPASSATFFFYHSFVRKDTYERKQMPPAASVCVRVCGLTVLCVLVFAPLRIESNDLELFCESENV